MSTKYRSVVYAWKGRGWTQEIKWLRIEGEERPEWKDQLWVKFLTHMAQEKWELVSTAPLGGGEGSVYGIVAYFRQ
ncbi:MAG: hypothetical protein F6K26_33815 [Moorea sp. SIO2I5]|nr:hypothetical protein [Moorena sp. SIO2I5]